MIFTVKSIHTCLARMNKQKVEDLKLHFFDICPVNRGMRNSVLTWTRGGIDSHTRYLRKKEKAKNLSHEETKARKARRREWDAQRRARLM